MTTPLPHPLATLGWGGPFDAQFAEHAAPGVEPGRVVADLRERSIVRTAEAEVVATVSGRFRHEALGPADFPVVGDWVAIEVRQGEGAGTIRAVCSRHISPPAPPGSRSTGRPQTISTAC